MRAFNDIAPYSVRAYGDAYALFLAGEPVDEGHDTYGDAVGRAHDLLDEAEAVQAADYLAESAELDAIYCEISRRYDASEPATTPRNVAVRLALEAIDGMNRPVPADLARAA